MESIQLAISGHDCAGRLHDALARKGQWKVTVADPADVDRNGVLVIDQQAFENLARPIPSPERIVLVSSNDPRLLARAWQAGIFSVVLETDSAETMMLAIQAAALRSWRSESRPNCRGN
jgi:DNA-binding NarL/FixJ family response regulator